MILQVKAQTGREMMDAWIPGFRDSVMECRDAMFACDDGSETLSPGGASV